MSSIYHPQGISSREQPSPKEVGLSRWRIKEDARFFAEDEARFDLEGRLEAYKLNKQGAELARIIGEKTAELADLMVAVSLDTDDMQSPRRVINIPMEDPEYEERIVVTGLDTRLRECPPLEANSFSVRHQERQVDQDLPYPGSFTDQSARTYMLGPQVIPQRSWNHISLSRAEDTLEVHDTVLSTILQTVMDSSLNSEIAAALSPSTLD